MKRERLPDRRASWTQKVKIQDPASGEQTFYLTCGEYQDGRLGEIWLEAQKEGSFSRGVLGALARQSSISLQNGVPVAELVQSLKGLSFPPQGKVIGSPMVSECTSLADWLAQEIEAAYCQARVESESG